MRMRDNMIYDPKCYELARHFLQDVEGLDTNERDLLCDELAQRIQQTIEEWFEEMTPEGHA